MRYPLLPLLLLWSLTETSAAMTPCQVDGKLVFNRECLAQQAQPQPATATALQPTKPGPAAESTHIAQSTRVQKQLPDPEPKPSSTATEPGPQTAPVKPTVANACNPAALFRAVVRENLKRLQQCQDPKQLSTLTTEDGRTLAHQAAANGSITTLDYLLNQPIDLNPRARGDWGATPLHLAAQNNHRSAIERLQQAGANLNARDYLKSTPLHKAAAAGASNAVSALIQLGADIQPLDRHQRSALIVASQQPRNAAVINALAQAGADLEHTDRNQNSALHLAALIDTTNAGALISQGADINRRNQAGQSPVLYAANDSLYRHWPRIHWLIKAGADLNIEDNQGQTLLKLAYQQQHEPLIKALLYYGVDSGNISAIIDQYQSNDTASTP